VIANWTGEKADTSPNSGGASRAQALRRAARAVRSRQPGRCRHCATPVAQHSAAARRKMAGSHRGLAGTLPGPRSAARRSTRDCPGAAVPTGANILRLLHQTSCQMLARSFCYVRARSNVCGQPRSATPGVLVEPRAHGHACSRRGSAPRCPALLESSAMCVARAAQVVRWRVALRLAFTGDDMAYRCEASPVAPGSAVARCGCATRGTPREPGPRSREVANLLACALHRQGRCPPPFFDSRFPAEPSCSHWAERPLPSRPLPVR
jgi:hypothetical protein